VLEEYTTEEQRSLLRFLCTKGLTTEDMHKEMFPVFGWKCLSRKVLQPWGQRYADNEEVETGAAMAEITVKKPLCCGFRRTGKAMGQVYVCWCRMCREIYAFLQF
jgi:hypothetical protein